MTDIAAKTPLIDLLRRVPEDARMSYEHGPTDHQMIPVGRLAREAAAEIERLRRIESIAKMLDAHLGEDDRMWSDDSTVSTEWIGSDGVRRSLTFGLFRQLRAALAARAAQMDGEG